MGLYINLLFLSSALATSICTLHAYTCSSGSQSLSASTSTKYLFSPNYPNYYPTSTTCSRTITTGSSYYNRVRIEFSDFQLQAASSSSGSCYDYVEVRDGSSSLSRLLGRFCGSNKPPFIVSSGSQLYIKFYSGLSTVSTGFSIKYRAISSLSSTTLCQTSNSFYENNNLQLSGSSGYLYSPNYPSNYPSSMQCTWVISVPSEYDYIKLYSTYKSTEYDYGCDNDYIRVRDGSTAYSSKKGDYCGSSSLSITSSGRYLWVRFRSNYYLTYGGFKLKYKAMTTSTTSGSVTGIVVGVLVAVGVVVGIAVGVYCCTRKSRPAAVAVPMATTTTTTLTGPAPTGTAMPPPMVTGGPYPGQPYQLPPPYSGPQMAGPPGQPGPYPADKPGPYPQNAPYPSGPYPPGSYPAGPAPPGGYPPVQYPLQPGNPYPGGPPQRSNPYPGGPPPM